MHNYVDQLRFITELQWAILKKKHCCQTLKIKTNAEVILRRVSCMRQGMLTLSGAPSTTSHLDINILSILHHLESPLG